MAGFNSAIPESELDEASGLLKTQRLLAETIETTCSGNDIHREGVLNMQNLQYAGISKTKTLEKKKTIISNCLTHFSRFAI
jgi:hypothetical protein